MGYHKRIVSEKLNVIKIRFDSNLVYQEHLARYNFVKKFVRDKVVLDLGCGIGDGTHELSKYAKKVVGVELDKERLKCAFNNFINTNISYLIMDGCSLGFADNVFDVVASLEVIEHLVKQDKFLSEIKRVLKDSGIVIISTPNKEVVRIEGTRSNPSHIREFTFKEFETILRSYFNSTEFYGQKRGKAIKGIAGTIHYFVRAIDLFNLRKLFPQYYKSRIYRNIGKVTGAKKIVDVTTEDVEISKKRVTRARNIIGVSKK
jgi:ubiquinone/menaquinone biosynthesis C-methylase UbiE